MNLSKHTRAPVEGVRLCPRAVFESSTEARCAACL